MSWWSCCRDVLDPLRVLHPCGYFILGGFARKERTMGHRTSKNGGKCCFWCGQLVTDGSKESGWRGPGPDC